MGKLINIDNGGTLTDICVVDNDKVYHTKTLTTPYDLSECFFAGLRKVSQVIYGEERLGDLLQDTDYIRYSTTQGTNALVEKKGQRLGLLLSQGDSIEGFTDSKAGQEMFQALVADRVQYVNSDQDDEAYQAALVNAVNTLTASGANRLVVALSGDNYQKNEKYFKRVFLAKFQRHKLGAVPILCSHELVEDSDDLRRSWTTLFNSFLHPAMERFLFSAEHRLRAHKFKTPLLIFRNDGGSSRVAKTIAIKTYSSGPQGGAEGSRAFANHYDAKRLLMMDIGGTTTDICMIEDGEVRPMQKSQIEQLPVSFKLSDIISYGVGGSSIHQTDGDNIKVGPESVGAAPGPACFGQGGEQATITDALVIKGVLDPASYFGGDLKLDVQRAEQAITKNIADPLDRNMDQVVLDMHDAWASKVAQSLADYCEIDDETTLLAFGGAGAMAVCAIAEKAGIKRVAIPAMAAVFSAYGISFSDIAHHYEMSLGQRDNDSLRQLHDQMTERARRDMYAEGFDMDADCECVVSLEVNRGGTVTLYPLSGNLALPIDLKADEQVSLKLSVVKPLGHASMGDGQIVDATKPTFNTTRSILSHEGRIDLPLYRVEDQSPGSTGEGPAIIEDPFFTCELLPGWKFEFAANKDILLSKIN